MGSNPNHRPTPETGSAPDEGRVANRNGETRPEQNETAPPYESGCSERPRRTKAASYLVYDLQCDWRAGAAWFESQLIDYDVYSNQGNWLYIAGLGTDPRGGRRFNPEKQAKTHDPEGYYQAVWA
jgi:hypothetical protein